MTQDVTFEIFHLGDSIVSASASVTQKVCMHRRERERQRERRGEREKERERERERKCMRVCVCM